MHQLILTNTDQYKGGVRPPLLTEGEPPVTPIGASSRSWPLPRKVKNPHIGESFDSFLKEEGIYESVQLDRLLDPDNDSVTLATRFDRLRWT
jgi:hypothetical protein